MAVELKENSGESPWETERKQRSVLNAEKRQAIIKVASISFASRGYHDTSMQDIARKLGVFKPTLYTFYKSKLALFDACVDQAVEIWLGAARQARDHQGSAEDRLRIYLSRNFEFCATEFGKSLQNLELNEISTSAEVQMRSMRSEVDRIFREIIEDGIGSGEISADFEPRLVSFALFGSFNFVSRWYKADGEFTADEVLDQYFRMFFSGLKSQ